MLRILPDRLPARCKQRQTVNAVLFQSRKIVGSFEDNLREQWARYFAPVNPGLFRRGLERPEIAKRELRQPVCNDGEIG